MTTNLLEKIGFEDFQEYVRAHFMDIFYFDIESELLRKKLRDFEVIDGKLEYKATDSNERKIAYMLSNGITKLRNSLNNHPAFYIHADPGIPLIGSSSFGLVDRNTSIIEIKPITGCNLNCIFCSVDEGISTSKANDFVVEASYLIREFRKLAEFKECKIEANINPHGEPLLYSDLNQLVEGISSTDNVNSISINTNGTLLNKGIIDKLRKSGLTRFNLSLNAIEPKIAVRLAGSSYDVNHVLEMAVYIAKSSELVIAPVLVPGINEAEMPKIIEFARKLKARVGIQNFLNYRFGRNPVKQLAWERFYSLLRGLENKHKINLIGGDFGIARTKLLPKPFRKGEAIKAAIVCSGRYKNEKIAVADNRSITLQNCIKPNGSLIRVKITRNKHNIFYGRCI